jgi:hypothetical protein
MMATLRPLALPLLLALLAVFAYNKKIRHEMVDFGVYRQAATRSLHAEPLYRPDDGHYQFKYLPAFALAMTPFAGVEEGTARMVWFALSFGLLAAFLRWSVAALPERRWSVRTLCLLTIVLMAKFYGHELTLGQTNLLLGAVLVAALLAIQIDLPLVGGALIGLAVFVKPYALIFVPWLAVTSGLAAAALSIAVVAAGLVVPAVVYGWAGNLDLLAGWYRTVTESTAPNLLVNDNISLAAMWAKWIGPGQLASGLAAASAGALLALVVAVWRQRRSVSSPEYLECALLMLAVPLLSPQGWDYVLLLSTPAVVCLVDRWRELRAAWRWSLAAALILMCLTQFDLMGRVLYGQFMALSIVSVSALGIAIGLAHLRWQRLA